MCSAVRCSLFACSAVWRLSRHDASDSPDANSASPIYCSNFRLIADKISQRAESTKARASERKPIVVLQSADWLVWPRFASLARRMHTLSVLFQFGYLFRAQAYDCCPTSYGAIVRRRRTPISAIEATQSERNDSHSTGALVRFACLTLRPLANQN